MCFTSTLSSHSAVCASQRVTGLGVPPHSSPAITQSGDRALGLVAAGRDVPGDSLALQILRALH